MRGVTGCEMGSGNPYSDTAAGQCPVSALSDTFHLSNEQLEAVFRRARRESPVVYLEDIDYWAVTRYDDIKAVSRRQGTLLIRDYPATAPAGRPRGDRSIQGTRVFAPAHLVEQREPESRSRPARRAGRVLTATQQEAGAIHTQARQRRGRPLPGRQAGRSRRANSSTNSRPSCCSSCWASRSPMFSRSRCGPTAGSCSLSANPPSTSNSLRPGTWRTTGITASTWSGSASSRRRTICRVTCSRCGVMARTSKSRTSTTSSSACCSPGTRRQPTCRRMPFSRCCKIVPAGTRSPLTTA